MQPPSQRAPSDLLAAELARDGARPFLTFYDDATGERLELSVATFANWVAKTAGLLVDGLGAGAGDRVALVVPPDHWQAAVWAVAVWRAGCVLDLRGDRTDDDAPPAVLVTALTGAAPSSAPDAGDVVALSLRPMGAPFAPGELPPWADDYAREVPLHADRFTGTLPEPHEPAALTTADGRLDGADVVARAGSLAASWGAGPGSRLLVLSPPGPEGADPADTLLATTVVPLLLGGSAVLCRNPDQAALPARREQERVTAVAAPGNR